MSVVAGGLLMAPASSHAAADSQGNDFWLTFLQNYQGTVQKTLFITGAEAASGTVEIPGAAFTTPFTVTPGAVTTVPLPDGSDLTTPDGVQAKAIHVTADHEVTVYGLSRQQFTTDAYLGLPTDVLGTNYRVMAFGPSLASELGVAASQNGTTVTITPSVDGQGGHAAGTPYDVVLNQGDAYQLQAASPPQDLTGTLITSDKPVAVYGGNRCANIPDSGYAFCDHVIEQMPPTTTWGMDFLTVPLKTRTKGDTFRFLASDDGTDVSVNGAVVASLNAGQYFTQQIDGQSRVTSTKPILVSQYSNGTTFDGVTSDPFEMLIPPTEQFGQNYTVTTPASGFRANFVNIVAPDADIGNVAIDGTAIPAAGFTAIGSSGFSGSQNDVALGTHNLTGTRPFGAYMYGFDQDDSYGYPGGQSFAPIASVRALQLTPPSAVHLVTTNQCVTATPVDGAGNAVPDVRIDFTVAGANPQPPSSINADGSGHAQLCYTGANVGDDTITATQGSLSATATKSWVQTLPAPTVPEGCGLGITGVDLQGDSAKNTLTGTDKQDRLRGSGEADSLSGAGAPDCLRGDEGDDDIVGGDGGDIIRGGADEDDIAGGEGGDNIRAQNGDDKVDGGAGDDFIKAQARGTDKVICGGGTDKVIGDRKDKIADDCEKVKIVNPH